MAKAILGQGFPLVLVGPERGISLIPTGTPLTRLNYFDGKFLRADDLRAEQDYVRQLVEHSNRAGGFGVVHGFEVGLATDGRLRLDSGLAVDPSGRVLLLTKEAHVEVAELIESSSQFAKLSAAGAKAEKKAGFADCELVGVQPPGQVVEDTDLYLLTIGHAEALCGEEDVFGKLCADACSDETERPYRVEGVVLRARPLFLKSPLAEADAFAFDGRHLRSRVASAFFADEDTSVASLISRSGLESAVWCAGAAAAGGNEVAVGVLARSGGTVQFVDLWTARRERDEASPRRSWYGRMDMRPWSAYLAQILQFQCQLRGAFDGEAPGQPAEDPCADAKALLGEASDAMNRVHEIFSRAGAGVAELLPDLLGHGGLSGFSDLKTKLAAAKSSLSSGPSDRVLLNGGIVELPPAGYLPVAPGGLASIDAQVRQLVGEGLDLRFCVVRADYVPHALEEAQHMERISLTQGLDDPGAKPEVDVLVPDGLLEELAEASPGAGYEARVAFFPKGQPGVAELHHGEHLARHEKATPTLLPVEGAARIDADATGAASLYLAGASDPADAADVEKVVDGIAGLTEASDAHLEKLVALRDSTPDADEKELAPNLAPGLFVRVNEVANEARAHFMHLRRHEALAALDGAPDEVVVFQPKPTDQQPSRLTALWTEAGWTRNPFVLQSGDRSSLSLRIAIAMPSAQSTLFDVTLKGDLVVASITRPRPDQAVVRGRMQALLTTRHTAAGQPATPKTKAVGVEVLGRLEGSFASSEGSASLRLVLDDEARTTFDVAARWLGDPQRVDVRLLWARRDQKVELARGSLARSEAVLRADNELHVAALAALDVVAAGLASPQFADANAKLLFPPAKGSTGGVSVRGTRDWVLFHRRRSKQCSIAEAPAVVVAAPPRRYQVYGLRVREAQELVGARVALLEGRIDILTRLGLVPAGQVEFGGGVATLTTSANAARQDWLLTAPGDVLLHGAVANESSAAADGVGLAIARLQRLESTLAPISAPSPNLEEELLPSVPAALAVPGTDGALVLFSLSEPVVDPVEPIEPVEPVTRETCLSVFAAPNADLLKRAMEAVRAGRSETALRLPGVVELGAATFEEGTADFTGDGVAGVLERWKSSFDASAAFGFVASPAGSNATDRQLHRAQAELVGRELGSGQLDQVVSPEETSFPVPCPSFAMFVPGGSAQPTTRTARVVVWTAAGDSRRIVELPRPVGVRFDANNRLIDPLTGSELEILKTHARFVDVELSPDRGATNDDARERLKAFLTSFVPTGLVAGNVDSGTFSLKDDLRRVLAEAGISADDYVWLQKG